MEKGQQIQSLTIPELVLGVQNCTNSSDRISFRTNEYLHELIRRCIKERNLSGEAEFFEKLAKDYFGRIKWMEKPKPKQPTYLSAADIGMSEEQANIKMREIDFYRNRNATH
jgi:hypothetical protein